MGLKKYFLIGILGIIVVMAGIMVFAKMTEEELPAVNNTVNIRNNTVSADDISTFKTFDDPRVANADIFFRIKAEGSDNVSFNVSSVALHNSFFDRWYILNLESTEIGELFRTISADAGVFYNRIYIYIPEATMHLNGSEKKLTMPSNKIYIENDYVMPMPNQNAYFELTFLKDKSVFENPDGSLVFAPQIRIQVYQNATESNLTGGGLWTGLTAGMDNNGNVRAGLKYTPE